MTWARVILTAWCVTLLAVLLGTVLGAAVRRVPATTEGFVIESGVLRP